MFKVEVVYVPPNKPAVHIQVILEANMTVGEAILRSGLAVQYPEVDGMQVGIFSRLVSLDSPVKAGDRIEIYRPLLIDPKEKRRQRARQKK